MMAQSSAVDSSNVVNVVRGCASAVCVCVSSVAVIAEGYIWCLLPAV